MRLAPEDLLYSAEEITDISMNWAKCQEALRDGWVIGGLLMRADVPFIPDGTDDIWCAVAVQLETDTPGPIPEARGWGLTPVDALADLHRQLLELRSPSGQEVYSTDG